MLNMMASQYGKSLGRNIPKGNHLATQGFLELLGVTNSMSECQQNSYPSVWRQYVEAGPLEGNQVYF